MEEEEKRLCGFCGEDTLDEACETGICLRCQREWGMDRFGKRLTPGQQSSVSKRAVPDAAS